VSALFLSNSSLQIKVKRKIANIAIQNGKVMSKSINILDKDYIQWIKELSSRYRRSQIKAAVKVNEEMPSSCEFAIRPQRV
jgi:hypothetical protein